MARVLDKADVGAHPARGELHSRQIRRVPGQFLNRACVSTVEPHTQIALQSQPVSQPSTWQWAIRAGVP